MWVLPKPFLLFALLVATPASAQRLTLVGDSTADLYKSYSSQGIALSWSQPRLVERPIADVISTKLGIAEGRVEVFRYDLENAPSKFTVLTGIVDGGGVKLKLSW